MWHGETLRNSPESDSKFEIGADRMNGSASKLMERGDKESGRRTAFLCSPPLLVSLSRDFDGSRAG